MKRSTTKFYNWATQKANCNKAPLWLALLFVMEIALFIPLDAVLMFFCLQKRNNILLYITLAAIASTISGLIGYFLCYFLWDLIGSWVIPHLISQGFFDRLSDHFKIYENWALFFGSLVPFPLKALSLVSGVFQLGCIPFAIFFASGRIIRFAIVGGAMALWGERVKIFLDRHFHRIFMLVGAKVAMAFLFLWALAR